MNWQNKITKAFKINYPIIQAPMLVVTTPEMVAAVSNKGCLGTLPLGYSNLSNAVEKIRAVKKLTTLPFAVNFFAYKPPVNTGIFPSSLKDLYEQYDIAFFEDLPNDDPYLDYTELINIVVEEKISAVSFHFGLPSERALEQLKRKNVVTLATATCTREAKLVEEAGLDMVIAQGIEAGGNRGSFLEDPLPQVGLFSLVPQIVDAVRVPVIAAGGIRDGRGIGAAFLLGALGVQLGSLFLRSEESGAPRSYKDAVANTEDTSTVLTKIWSGRYGRCIPNKAMQQIKEEEIWPSPIQNYLTNKLRQEGRRRDNKEIQSLWAGQSAAFAPEKRTGDILRELIDQTSRHLSNLPFASG